MTKSKVLKMKNKRIDTRVKVKIKVNEKVRIKDLTPGRQIVEAERGFAEAKN